MSNNNEHPLQIFSKDETIVSQGEEAQCAYQIVKGRASVFLQENNKIVDLSELGPGEIFGETSLFHNGIYSANVKALEETHLIAITPDILQAKLEDCDPLLKSIIEMLVERLSKTNQALLESETREFIDIGFI